MNENIFADHTIYTYYSTQRPISFGTYPTGNDLHIENYDNKTYVEAIGKEAWGEITYSEPLTEKQLSDYELTADPSIKLTLQQRVSGDDLLNAQDLINDIENVGGTVDEYGNVTVFHRTDAKSAERIKATQAMIAKEDGLFFSTKENGQNAGYGESVVKLSIPVEKLVLDDIFTDEAHLRYPLGNTRRIDVADYLVNDSEIREVTHGEEIGELAQSIYEFYDQSDEAEIEEVQEIYDNLSNGNVDSYVNDLLDYRESFKGELSPKVLTQIYGLVQRLNNITGRDNELDGNSVLMPVAVESTSDYNDYFFHANMNNTGGRGREDYYRLVYVNDVGNLQPLTNDVFTTSDEAIKQADSIGGLNVISYDDIVNSVEKMRSRDDVIALREKQNTELTRLKDAMKLVGWEYRQSYGQQTFWYQTDPLTDRVTERDFDNFQSVQNYLEDVIITDPSIEKQFNALVYGESEEIKPYVALQNENTRYIFERDRNTDYYDVKREHLLVGGAGVSFDRMNAEKAKEEIADLKSKKFFEFRNAKEVSWYATANNNTPYDEKWEVQNGILIPVESHSVGITTIDRHTCSIVDEWQNDTASYTLGRDTDESDGVWYYAKVIDTDTELGGMYTYEHDVKPSRNDIEDEHLDHLSQIALDRHEAEYGADGSRVFPHLNDEPTHGEENSRITLHVKYKEPIIFNGFKIEKDSITFDNKDELNSYINGNVAFDMLDNAVRKRDNEILQYAENENGEVVWKADEIQDLQLHEKMEYKGATITREAYNSYAIDNSYGVRSAYFDSLQKAKNAVDSVEADKKYGSVLFNYFHNAENRQLYVSEFMAEQGLYKMTESVPNDKGENHDYEYIMDREQLQKYISTNDYQRGKLEEKRNEKIMTEKERQQAVTEEPQNAKDKLEQQLEDGIKQMLDSDHFADWCKKHGKLYYNNYSLKNALLTYLQKPEATYVCGYESWKKFGRQVKKDVHGLKIFAPEYAKDYHGKGSLFASIKKSCNAQFKKDPNLEFATFHLGNSKMFFNMYKNGLFDVKINDEVKMPHITSDEMRKFLDQSVIGKVLDVSDTTSDVPYLWVSKDSCKKEEMVLDDNGNPIKNQRGQYKIVNSEERKARFNVDIDMTIKEQDADKMQMLYETLQNISNNKGIPMSEADPSKDKTLGGGALGYYRHATPEFPNGNIVISSDLSLTDKVAVSFHEIAHSDMHRDIDKLKAEMGNDVDTVTRQMKEVQAEAVAYMTASTFGIETEHKSFAYIANWSDGRELKSLESSLDVIYNESRKLLKDIEKDLDTKGFTMSFEPKDKTPLTEEQKKPIVEEYKGFVLNELRANETIQKSAFEDLKNVTNEKELTIIKEQILLTRKIEEKISSLDKKTEQFEKSDDRQEQVKLEYQMRAEREQIAHLQNKINDLSLERVNVIREEVQKNKADMKQMYANNPVKAMEQLKKDFSQMSNLSDTDLKYLANSKFISRTYSKYLGSDNAKFVDLAMKQLENFKEVLSKNKTAVEIGFCEQWGDEPIFEAGTLAHPKEANKILASAEKQIRAFKEQAEKQGEYYPYTKCAITVYSYTGKNNLSVLNTRVDIGDKEQKDLTDHLTQICSKGDERQEILNNFVKSTRERTNIQLLTPQKEQEQDSVVEEKALYVNDNSSRTMSEWKDSMQMRTESVAERSEKVIEKEETNEKE